MTNLERVAAALTARIELGGDGEYVLKMIDALLRIEQARVTPEELAKIVRRLETCEASLTNMDAFLVKHVGITSDA